MWCNGGGSELVKTHLWVCSEAHNFVAMNDVLSLARFWLTVPYVAMWFLGRIDAD